MARYNFFLEIIGTCFDEAVTVFDKKSSCQKDNAHPDTVSEEQNQWFCPLLSVSVWLLGDMGKVCYEGW